MKIKISICRSNFPNDAFPKIGAIKAVRTLTDKGLAESKLMVEEMLNTGRSFSVDTTPCDMDRFKLSEGKDILIVDVDVDSDKVILRELITNLASRASGERNDELLMDLLDVYRKYYGAK